jgi:hypothetical protein
MVRKVKGWNRYINLPHKRKTGCDNGGAPTNPPAVDPNILVDANGRVFAKADKMEPEIQAALDEIFSGVSDQ